MWVADWQSDGEIGRIIKMKKEKGKRRKIVARQKTQDQEIFAMSFYLERNSPFFVMEIGFWFRKDGSYVQCKRDGNQRYGDA